MTQADHQFSGSLPCLIEWLEISHIGPQKRSAHSRISLANIFSRLVVLDLFSLFLSEKTLFALVEREMKSCVCASEIPLVVSAIRVNLTFKF